MDQDNQDQPLSSEELLRRAREGLGESTPPPPEDFTIESYPPSPPASYEPTEDTDTEFEVEMEPPAPEPVSDRIEYSPPTPDYLPEPDPIRQDTGVGDWAPPPVDGQDYPSQVTTPAPMPVPKRRFNLGSVIGVLVLLGVVGSFLFNFFDSSKTVDEIAIGDCMDIPEDDEFSTIDPIDCTEPHDLEVYAVLDLSTVSSQFAVNASYPGDMALYEAALDACLVPFEPYVGTEYEFSTLWIDAFTPTIEGWEEFDDREVQCVLLQVNEDLTDIVKSSRTFRNSGL